MVIENVRPEVDNGRYPIKRTVGEPVTVEADVFVDGHDKIASLLLYRREDEREWTEVPMAPLGNDRWRAAFRVTEIGRYRYTVMAWVDHFQSWRHDLARRPDTDPDLKMVFSLAPNSSNEPPRMSPAKTRSAWAPSRVL